QFLLFLLSSLAVCWLLPRSPGSVQSAGEVQKTEDSLHQPAVVGVGTPVQAEQIPLQTETFRGGHIADAHRDPGTFSSI
ncbi:unnamed protein product, partial [Staurois parvus]